MGLEIAEQFGWELPDVIFYPTGGGTGPIGMVKAFDELETLGWIGSKRSRMLGDFLILRGVRKTGGCATAVDDDAILAARKEVADAEGILLCPEGAATYAAYKRELASGRITSSETVVLFNCATGLKYDMPPVTARLDRHAPIDYGQFGSK